VRHRKTVGDSRNIAIECRGDHREMGLAQGEARRASLENLPKALVELAGLSADSVLGGAVGRISPGIGSLIGRVGNRVIGRDLERHYPSQLSRLRGIAEGAGLPIRALYVGPAVELALNRSIYTVPPKGACTAMAVSGDRAANGEPMIAKNFDYPAAGIDTYLARISRPSASNVAASIDITAAPLPGCHEGVNEHGLAVAYNYGSFRGTPKARVSITSLVQELLEQCDSVESAIAHLERRPRAGGALLMLADASGALASVELAPDTLSVRGADRGVLAHANHAVTDKIAERDTPTEAVFPKWWRPVELRGRRLRESSESRHARAEALLACEGTIDEQALVAMVSDHNGGEGDDLSICRHGPYYQTTCSVILYPRRRAIALAFGPPCRTELQTLAL
jgi:hypothetical protein